MEYLYHPVSGERILASQLDGASAFIEDRLFKPKKWQLFYYDEADKNNKTYGIEIELNTAVDAEFDKQARIDICIELLKVLNRNGKHFHIMRDNSVRNGIELVSAPMTFKYWIETFNVKEVNDLFAKLKLSATIDTGLHIHVGEVHTKRIRELYIQLFAISYPMWVHLSDRRYKRIQERYVSTSYFYQKPELKSRFQATLKSLIKTGSSKVNYYKVEYYDYQVLDRYLGLNFFNDKTVEFRMFVGTNDFFEIIQYLTFVDVIAKMAKEISDTRVNDVYDLDTFVKRTQSELMLAAAVRYIRFINLAENKERIYRNGFMYLDAYWYRVYIKHIKRKDLMVEKIIYEDYLKLLAKKSAFDHDCLKTNNIRKDIDLLLKNNMYEIVKVDSEYIYCMAIFGSTKRIRLKRSEVSTDFIFLRGISEAMIVDNS